MPTGRTPDKGPNIQNVPVRTEEGRKIRDAFVERDHPLPAADYSGIEKSLLAAIK